MGTVREALISLRLAPAWCIPLLIIPYYPWYKLGKPIVHCSHMVPERERNINLTAMKHVATSSGHQFWRETGDNSLPVLYPQRTAV